MNYAHRSICTLTKSDDVESILVGFIFNFEGNKIYKFFLAKHDERQKSTYTGSIDIP